MSDNNQMTQDSAELSEVRDSLCGVAIPARPPLETIKARGRARRRQRLSAIAGLSTIGFAVSGALALGLTGVLGHTAVRSLAPGMIRTASFTLRHNSNGTDTLTLNQNELLDSAALQSDLAKYDIPAKVTSGSFCSSVPAPAGFSQVVSIQPAGETTVQEGSDEQPTITIDPSAMPAGTELSFGNFQLATGEYAGEQQADAALIDTNSYACTSTPPGSPEPFDGFQLIYGGGS